MSSFELFIYLFIVSSLSQLTYGFIKYNKLANPITYINILFFLHNWSFSFNKLFFSKFDINWRSPILFDYQSEVLLVNLVSLWLVFFIFNSLRKTTKFNYDTYSCFRYVGIFPYLYVAMTILSIVYLYSTGVIDSIYGANQALTSDAAFSPILAILAFRYVFASIYLILKRDKSTALVILIFLLELYFSILDGGRKALLIITLSLLIPYIEKYKFNLKRTISYAIASIVIIYFFLIMTIFRGVNAPSIIEKAIVSNEILFDKAGLIIPLSLYMANSEGVQNWTYELVSDGDIDLLYGKSYIQALVNIVWLRPLQGDISDWQAAYHFKYAAFPNEENHGYDLSYTAEAIMNWGIYGSVFSFIILAIILAKLYNNRFKNDHYKMMYYAIWPILFISFRTDSTALFRLFSYFIVVSVVSYILFGRKKIILIKDNSSRKEQ
jgi:hypothetical protein